jgi:hypothetical protein
MPIPDIVVQIKGQTSTAVISQNPVGNRLVDLLDVDASSIQDGYVLAWSSAIGKFQVQAINGGTF